MSKSRLRYVPVGELVGDVTTWNPARDSTAPEIEYIDISSVDQYAKVVLPKPRIPAALAPSRARQLVQAGDILVSTVRPNLNGVARVPDHLAGATASTGFCVLRPDQNKIDGAYLFQWVKSSSFVVDMTKKATGQSYPAVSDRVVLESYIPYLPLAEQRRIAAILDGADALRGKRRQSLVKLDQLAQSIFLEMFGDPRNRRVLSHAPTSPRLLGDICRIRTGKLDANAADEGGLHPFFTCSVEPLRIDTPAFDCKAVIVAGNGDLNVKYFEGKFNAYQRTYVIESLDESVLVPQFLYAFLSLYITELRNQAIGGVIKYIKLPYLTNAAVELPTTDRQREFAFRIGELENLKTVLQASQSKLGSLFASLQRRAFRGEL